MLWLIALVLAAALVVAGVSLVSIPAGLVVAGILLGCIAALFIDPATLRKGGRP